MEKLKSKISEIESKNRNSKIIYFVFFVTLLGIYTLLYYDAIKEKNVAFKQKARAEEANELLRLEQENLENEKLAEFERRDSILRKTSAQLQRLQAELDELKGENLSRAVDQSLLTIQQSVNRISKIESAVSKKQDSITTHKGNFVIRLYSYNPDPIQKRKIVRTLGGQDYLVTVYPDWHERKSFFATSPTVFFYDRGNKVRAQNIAKLLSDSLNINFISQAGSGLGVFAKDRPRTFIIHYMQ